jgi:hypothetical protein
LKNKTLPSSHRAEVSGLHRVSKTVVFGQPLNFCSFVVSR